ncbi:hypothetical protein A7U60_g5406 [Sanghuangporus baumii]|uniref:Uncharacterized protein n=1 Tax=Sanghuangporus baumii TaxID=108892 RepID=A0A9Q5HX09_SANBA|nr:hypothetical protein A7U60_g5406 [Sanghuangporus baumii]
MTQTNEEITDYNKEDLLALLQAHGQDFLSSFGSLPQSSSQPSRKRRKLEPKASNSDADESSDDESTGFDMSSEEDDSDDGDYSEEMNDEEDEQRHDDEFRSDTLQRKQPEVVVFSGGTQSTGTKMSKYQAKSFMSSKVSKLRQEVNEAGTNENGDDDSELEEERTNVQNDKLLHKLVHTQLLSGSLNHELDLTPAQRRKALDGRVMEIAGNAKLGKGESIVRQEERKKAAKKVRMGLERKVDERRRKAVEEAKDLGNYHRSIKHLFEADEKKRSDRRKRERGLKLGVGKFSGGVLKLSRDDIASVRGNARPTRGKGAGRKGPGRK